MKPAPPVSSGSVTPATATHRPLELEGIAHRFGRRWVLRGLDLEVDSGEVVVLAGSNGAGKTTLLRIGATLLRPMRGRGRIRNLDLIDDSDRIRGLIGLLGHSPALYEDLTAEENLQFSFRMRGLEGAPEEIRPILDEVGLGEHASTRVRRFSAGMRRRVAVGRILASLPHLLLMDEPYASLDRTGVAVVNRMIRRVVEAGGGVLLATHDLQSGADLTDRVLTLDRGLLQEGAAADPGEPAR
jgi:heme exporter protein A